MIKGNKMKILIDAYLDLNIGDDLMVQLLAEELKEHEVYLDCKNDVLFKPFEGLSNVKKTRLSHKRIIRFKQMSNFDAIIKVGGSIYNVNSNRLTLKWFLNLPGYLYLKIKRVKMVVIGCNTGPFINWMGKLVTAWELKLMDLVTVRDVKSYNFLQENKIKRRFLFPDIVFSYPVPLKKHIQEKILGISVYRSIGNTGKNNIHYKTLAEVADKYILDNSGEVYLIAFDAETENDLAAAYHVKSYMKNPEKAKIVGYSGNVKELTSALEICEKIIAVRFHSAILALIYKVPFIPIIYSNKLENLLADIENKEEKFYLDNLTSDSATEIYQALEKLGQPVAVEQYKPYGRYHLLAAKYLIEGNEEDLKKLNIHSI